MEEEEEEMEEQEEDREVKREEEEEEEEKEETGDESHHRVACTIDNKENEQSLPLHMGASWVQLNVEAPKPISTEEEQMLQEYPSLHKELLPSTDKDPPSQGSMQEFWAKCENKGECKLCGTAFSLLVRRHHCRKCYSSVCSRCSPNSSVLPEFGDSAERVCERCWSSMQTPNSSAEEQS